MPRDGQELPRANIGTVGPKHAFHEFQTNFPQLVRPRQNSESSGPFGGGARVPEAGQRGSRKHSGGFKKKHALGRKHRIGGSKEQASG